MTDENKEVTLVITSCGRHDLLEKTIKSFELFNTYPLSCRIIINDTGDERDAKFLSETYPEFHIIHNHEKRGQIRSIDKAYEFVATEYVFHCEDDWQFCQFGFIEKSLAVLETDPNVLQVHLRDVSDLNGHPVVAGSETIYDTEIGLTITTIDLALDFMNTWNGFSFNPGLKRMSDYKAIGQYTNIGHESAVSRHYGKLGYHAVALVDEKHVEHIGWSRHVEDLHSEDLPK